MSNHINERELQNKEARGRNQLHVRPGFETRGRDGKPPVKFAKGHDAVLKAAQDSGAICLVQPMNGDAYSGKVLNRDRYTVTLLVEGRKRVVYKHAVEYFELEEGNVSKD